MFQFNRDKMEAFIQAVIADNLSLEAFDWFNTKINLPMEAGTLNNTFALIPRKVGKAVICLEKEQVEAIKVIRSGLSIEGWSVDRLCRVYLLMKLDSSDKDVYFRLIDNLFLAAEMSELVALYSALPVLAYPGLWVKRCSEGIRSNIGLVLESIMYNNPYPAENLDQAAWNQLVLKAFFTDKNVHLIYGLDERANAELAYILSDYAHERWAAFRSINPQLWRLTTKFLDVRLFDDIKKVMREGDTVDQRAAALAAYHSDYFPAKDFINSFPDLKNELENRSLTWDSLALAERS